MPGAIKGSNVSSAKQKQLRRAVKLLREIGKSDEHIALALDCSVEDIAQAMGRAKSVINLQLAQELYSIGCTDEDVAGFLGIDVRTLERRKKNKDFRAAMTEGKATARVSLRRSQFDSANRGNPTLLIWLGKQYLGQKQNPEPPRRRASSLRVTYDKEGDKSRKRHHRRLAREHAKKAEDD